MLIIDGPRRLFTRGGLGLTGKLCGPTDGDIDGLAVIGEDVTGLSGTGELVSGVEVGICDGNIDGEAVVGEDVAG